MNLRSIARKARSLARAARDRSRAVWWQASAVLLFRNWPTYFQLLRQRGSGRRVLETRDGVKLWARENIWDARIIREIFVQRPYLRGFSSMPDSPVVVDIGGYIGDFALYAAKRMGARRVVVYEPTSENWAMLNDNIDLNSARGQIEAVNRAVGRDGVLTLNVDTTGLEVHSSAYWYSGSPTREVTSVSLDTVIAEHGLERIDLLKVDCEGGEYDIFAVASDDALARVDRVTLEWHEVGNETDSLCGAMRTRLRNAGFRIWVTGPILRGERA
jgi:FkbM family methyltransferase